MNSADRLSGYGWLRIPGNEAAEAGSGSNSRLLLDVIANFGSECSPAYYLHMTVCSSKK